MALVLQQGGGWRVVEGAVEGQTQTDLPSAFDEAYFAHPIDLHLATKTIQGELAKIQLQVWHHDVYGRQELVGYGSLFLPSTPGEHELTCHIWRPKGSTREEVMQRFVGGGIQVCVTYNQGINNMRSS
ncbi:B9 protein, partial [Ostertagia ostertagi]